MAESIERPVASLAVTYDTEFGFPRRNTIDVIELAVDDESKIEMLSFAAQAAPQERSEELAPGWNLTAWTGTTAVVTATASIAGQFDRLLTWESGSGFRFYSPELPAALSTVSELSLGESIWLHVTDPQGATWLQPAYNGERSLTLDAGFQLVAWTGPEGTDAAEAVAGLGLHCAGCSSGTPRRRTTKLIRPLCPLD